MDQKFFLQPFAFAGDRTPAVPDPVQPSGTVSFNAGYGFDYQRELGVDPDAKAIERTSMNYLFYAITDALGQYQRSAAPEFISSADNGGAPFPYGIGAMVKYRPTPADPWVYYVSKVATNTSLPTVAADWQPFVFAVASNAQALAGTDDTTIMTPLKVKNAIAASTPTIPAASETVAGVAEIATQGEVNTGTDDARFVTPLKLATWGPQATTAAVGRTRYATSAETTALSLTTAAVTPGGLAALAATKATLGALVTFNDVSIVRPGTPTQGALFLGNTNFRYFFFDGTDYRVGDGAGTPQTVWHAGNFTPASKANVASPNFTGSGNLGGAAAGSYTPWACTNPGGVQIQMAANGNIAGELRVVSNHPLHFFTNNTKRGEVTAAGVLVWDQNIASLGGTAGVAFEDRTSPGFLWTWYTSGAIARLNLSGAGDIMWVTSAGNLQAAGQMTATAYNIGSSRRVKDIDGPLPYGLREVLALETVVGNYRTDYRPNDKGRKRLFLIAENVADLIPEATQLSEEAKFEDLPVLTLDPMQLVPVLVRALQQEHAERIAEREAAADRMDALEKRLAALEG